MSAGSFQVVDALSALSPGADLWVLADLEYSRWAKKIDWYLNFQMARATPRHAVGPSAGLNELLSKIEFEAPEITVNEKAPLMIASGEFLPNRSTVVIPIDHGLDAAARKDWVDRCHRVWSGLGRPNLRVFLPGPVSTEQFMGEWEQIAKHGAQARVECVPESELDLLRS